MKQISFSQAEVAGKEAGDAARAVSRRDGEGDPLAGSPLFFYFLLHQIPMTVSLRISKPPLIMKSSSGRSGSVAATR